MTICKRHQKGRVVCNKQQGSDTPEVSLWPSYWYWRAIQGILHRAGGTRSSDLCNERMELHFEIVVGVPQIIHILAVILHKQGHIVPN